MRKSPITSVCLVFYIINIHDLQSINKIIRYLGKSNNHNMKDTQNQRERLIKPDFGIQEKRSKSR